MIRFKYFNNDKLKKLGSTVLVTTILGTSAVMMSGCKSKFKEEFRYNYGIVVENDIAVIYSNVDIDINSKSGIQYYMQIDENEMLILPASETHIYQTRDYEAVLEYAKSLVSVENGIVKYYDEYTKNIKILQITRASIK